MQSIIDIKNILDKLNQREKNAAKKYFTRHYSNTKELQLLTLIDGLSNKKQINLENRICKLGYVSSNSKSFQKLKSRLKKKLFDYLVSTVSLNEIRQIDSHSFLKHRLKKLLFQSDVLIEKGFFIQANETLRTCLRLSQDYEQFPQLIESLDKLRTIEQIKGNLLGFDRLTDKIKLFQEKFNQYKSIEFLFNRFISELDKMVMFDIHFQINEIEKEINNASLLKGSERLALFSEIITVLKLQHERKFAEACILITSRLKKFRSESMRHSLTIKMLYYDGLIELLLLTGHERWAKHFLNSNEYQSKPLHLKERSAILFKHFELTKGLFDNWTPFVSSNIENLSFIYQIIHHYYLTGSYKKALELINRHVRQYPINSVQQLDLMTLEILCQYQLKRFDLLDYRLQSYLKNLAYRSKFNVPEHHHEIYKLLNQCNKQRKDVDLIEKVISNLNSTTNSGLLELRSFHPNIAKKWINHEIDFFINKEPIKEKTLFENQLNNVA